MSRDMRYEEARRALTSARLKASMTQSEVAARLGRPQSFVSKYENGERTLDLVEFLDVCEAVSTDPVLIVKGLKAVHA